MDVSTWPAVRKIGRWVLGLLGLFDVIGTTWELFARPNRDILVEMLGSAISLHAILAGAAGVGIVLVLVAIFPVLRWIYKFLKKVEDWRIREYKQCQSDAEEISKIAYSLHGHRTADMPNIAHDTEFGTLLRTVHFEFASLRKKLFCLGVYIPELNEDNNFEATLDILSQIRGSPNLSVARKTFRKQDDPTEGTS